MYMVGHDAVTVQKQSFMLLAMAYGAGQEFKISKSCEDVNPFNGAESDEVYFAFKSFICFRHALMFYCKYINKQELIDWKPTKQSLAGTEHLKS